MDVLFGIVTLSRNKSHTPKNEKAFSFFGVSVKSV